ncbi:hypothetical protein M6B38_409105 [Iris pallida]|uniref:Uncharacterized protein n=1 Tax=Iris pallida TaxID=29817 RepID=A0AAX6FP23_IRIPA|nr:hypothetical protein M6B38_409105 [Iris pallida]
MIDDRRANLRFVGDAFRFALLVRVEFLVNRQLYYPFSITLSKASVLAGYCSNLWARARDIS